MVNLKPCPFCGSPADPEGWSSIDRKGPACTNGKCNGSADSAEAWNLRAHNSDSAEPVAWLVKRFTEDGEKWSESLRYRDEEGPNIVSLPLYLASPPAKEVTDDMVERMASKLRSSVFPGETATKLARELLEYALTNRTPDDEVGNG